MKKNFYTLLSFLLIPLFCIGQTQVPDIATLRSSAQGSEYTLVGEVVLTFQQDFRGQKYIQDGTAAILIDDNSGTITTSYNINDGITGLTGTLGEFGGMLQFVPSADPGAASSIDNVVTPQEITFAELTANFEEYESELVLIKDVSFTDMGTSFSTGTVYATEDPTGTYNYRTTFFDADYIGSIIPEIADVTGLPNSRDDGEYFTARSTDDIDGDIIGPMITDVDNIADLRAGTIGNFYRLTSEAILTYQQGFRNQKYIQDITAGVLIDDNPGNITSTYEVMDGITGIVGSLGEFGGMIQFSPTEDPGAATSSGNTVSPNMITLADLANDFEAYEAELTMITGVSFDMPGGTFENGEVYGINDGTAYNFRTTFFDMDYIGTEIPSAADILGIANSRNDGEYFSAINMGLFIISNTDNLALAQSQLFPNPVSDVLQIQTQGVDGDVLLSCLNSIGQRVKSQMFNISEGGTITWNLNELNSGLYIVEMTKPTSGNSVSFQIIKE